ncbi:putative reverse transcriptase domain-containing protein [Tanacetum coccineum]
MSSDEASFGVTYTSISSGYEEPSEVGSPGVVIYGYNGLPMHPVDPPSPDYVPGPEESEQAPLLLDYVPGPEYPEYMAPSDEEDPEDESVDGRGGGGEEEHLASADSTAAASLVVDLIPSTEEREPFENDKSAATPPPSPTYRTTARTFIRAQTPMPFPSEAEIPLPSFPVPSPPTTSLTYTKAPLGYKVAEIQLRTTSPPPLPLSSLLPLSPPIILPCTRSSMVLIRAVAPSTYILAPRSGTPPSGTPPILPITLPTSSIPLPLPFTDCRADVLEAVLPPRKRLCITPGPRFDVRESSSIAAARPTRGFRADYAFVGTLDARIRCDPYIKDTDEIYMRLDDAQSDRSLIAGQLNVLRENKRYHANTTLLVKIEARVAREEWAQSMDASHKTRSGVMKLRMTRQRIEDSDKLTRHIQHEHDRFREFQRTRDVALEDADSLDNALAEREIQRNHNLNGDGSQGSGSGIARPVRPTRECTYTDFLKCQPMNFKGTEGVGLTQWYERMKIVFNISNCAVENQVKFATCTLHDVAFKWWKSHVKTVGHDAAYGGLALLCERMFLEESDKIDKYVDGLPDMIHRSVMASKTKIMQDVIDFTTELMDKKICTFAESYTARHSEKKEYGGSLPKCSKCNYHHNGPCAPMCHKCNKVGHLATDCRSSGNANTGNNQRTTRANQRGNGCYECGAQGNFKRECPKLKNNNRGNQGGC